MEQEDNFFLALMLLHLKCWGVVQGWSWMLYN